MIFVGSGHDLLDGTPANDTWVKFFSPAGESLVSDSVFLVSKLDGSIYIAGHGSNLVTTKSARDWQILKF